MQQPTQEALLTAATRKNLKPIQAGFVLTGVVTTLLGPIIPILSVRWRIGDDRTGYLFTAQFLGALLGTLATGWLFPRLGYIRPIAAAFFLMSAGTAGLALSGWPVGLTQVFTYGLGLGIVVPGVNLYVAGTAPANRAAALNVLNFLWGVGAVSGPPLIAVLCRSQSTLWPLMLLATLLALAAAIILLSCDQSEHELALAVSGEPPGENTWRKAPAILIALFIFLYVGMENSIGGWAATYAGRITTWPETAWPVASLVFWGALMAGRAAAPLILSRITELRLIAAALVAAIVGNTLIVCAVSAVVLLCGILIAGLGFATLYPMTVATLSRFYGARAARLASFVFGMAALGGATLPWAVGRFSAAMGSLRFGLLVPLVASLAMIGLQISVESIDRRYERAAQPCGLI